MTYTKTKTRRTHARSLYWGGVGLDGKVDESEEPLLLGCKKPHLEPKDRAGIRVLVDFTFVVDKVKVKHLSVVLKRRVGRIILRPFSR